MNDEKKYWNPKMETMPLEKMKELQGKRLRELVALAYEKTNLYRQKFDKAGIKPSDINGVEDISKLPITDDVKDIRNTPFSDRLTIPLSDLERLNSTSGITTGQPEPIPFNKKDNAILLDSLAQARWTAGVKVNDVIQMLDNYDLSELCYEKLGSKILLLSAGRYMLDKQIIITKSAGVTVLEHFPSQLDRFIQEAARKGMALSDFSIRLIIGVGEPLAQSRRMNLEKLFNAPIMSIWETMELGAAAAECVARDGMHLFAQRLILEVIDPDTGKPLPDGEEGELIATPLLYETMPLIRFKTGDIAKMLPYKQCSCGRTLPKISMIRGRVSQIMNVNGKMILPIDIEEAIADVDGLAGDYQIISEGKRETSRLKLKLDYLSEIDDLRSLNNSVDESIKSSLGIDSEIELVQQGAFSSTSKAIRFL
ncbi:MAG: hypothetical protein SVR08_07610 [Spirochaetota bacterium]|nr:hypothetical protein [Spirochaetota bacterium]